MKTETPVKTKYDSKTNEYAQAIIDCKDDRVKRWKLVHKLLRKQNKQARKEQDITAKDAKYFRDEKFIKKDKTEIMGLRWGVALPPTTYTALVQADILVMGKSDLQHPDKDKDLDLKGSNKIVKDLEKAFPQYKVS